MKYLWSNTGTAQELLDLDTDELKAVLMDTYHYDEEMMAPLDRDDLEEIVYANLDRFSNDDIREYEDYWLGLIEKQTLNGWVLLVGPNDEFPAQEQTVAAYDINDEAWYEGHEITLLEDNGKMLLEIDEQLVYQMFAIPKEKEALKAFVKTCMQDAVEVEEEDLYWQHEEDAEYLKNDLIEQAIEKVADDIYNGCLDTKVAEYNYYVDEYCDYDKVPSVCQPIQAPVADATPINYDESLKEAEEGRQGFIVWQSGGSLGDKFDLEDKIFDTKEDAQAAVKEWKASYGRSKSYYKPEARIYKYKGKTAKEMRAEWNNTDESLKEQKLPVEKRKINEELKLYISLSSYKPWSGAVDTWNAICDADKLDELEYILEDMYPKGLTQTQLNDLLWFDADEVLSWFGLSKKEANNKYDESLEESTVSKSDFINAYIDAYGGTKKDAEKKWESESDSYKKELVKGFKGNAKKSFLVDSLREDFSDNSNEFIDFISQYIQNNESDLNVEVEWADKYGTRVVLTPDYDDVYQAITFNSDGSVDVEEGDMGGVNNEEVFNSYQEFIDYFKATLGDNFNESLNEDSVATNNYSDNATIYLLLKYFNSKQPHNLDWTLADHSIVWRSNLPKTTAKLSKGAEGLAQLDSDGKKYGPILCGPNDWNGYGIPDALRSHGWGYKFCKDVNAIIYYRTDISNYVFTERAKQVAFGENPSAEVLSDFNKIKNLFESEFPELEFDVAYKNLDDDAGVTSPYWRLECDEGTNDIHFAIYDRVMPNDTESGGVEFWCKINNSYLPFEDGFNSVKEFTDYLKKNNVFDAMHKAFVDASESYNENSWDDKKDLTEAKAKKPEILKAELEEIKDLYNSWGADAFYAVPYKQFKQEFPEFAKYVIEAFLKEVVGVKLKDYSAAEVEEMWQADDDRDRLIQESDWESLLNGAETLANGEKVQWERLL